MHALLFPLLFIGGIVTGSYASVVGGGALLGFPLLIFIGFPTAQAIATQRFAAVILEMVSALRFQKEKKLNTRFIMPLAIAASCGAAIGASAALRLDPNVLNIAIIPFLILALLALFYKDRILKSVRAGRSPSLPLLCLCIFLVAIYGGFFGAAFGFFAIVVLSFFGFAFIESAALARVAGFFMSLTSAIVFAHAGVINYVYGLFLGAGYGVGSWIGIGMALKKGEPYIRTLLAAVVVLTVLQLLLKR